MHTIEDEKYQVVEEILSAPDYYHVLGIQQDASDEEIKKAYKTKCRICHPDKFVPSNPRATKSFQILSTAYQTLSDYSKRQMYDALNLKGDAPKDFSFCFGDHHEAFNDVLQMVFNELREGEFGSMRALIYSVNKNIPSIQIPEARIDQIEEEFKAIYSAIKTTQQCYLATKQCYEALRLELVNLYQMQQEFNSLSYFNVWKRTQLTASICTTLLQLPLTLYSSAQQ